MEKLFAKLWGLIDIPYEPLSVERNKANVISALVNVGIMVILGYLMMLALTRGLGDLTTLSFFAALLFLGGCRWLIGKGYANQISLIVSYFVWGFTVYIFLFNNSLRAPPYSIVLAFFITYVGLMHSRKVVAAMTILTLAVNFAITVAEARGYYFAAPNIPNVFFTFFAQLIFFTGSAYLASRTVGNLNHLITRTKSESDERLKAELQVRDLNAQLAEAYDTTLQGWSLALELRDKETEGHSQRVTNLALDLSRSLGITDEAELRNIRYGALLHDIGKMGIPDEILRKNGKLTPEEFEIVKQHPVYAYELLKEIKYLQNALDIPYLHHEKWDGSGYPLGLSGKKIPLSARIFAVVDVWDALTSDRHYRKALPYGQARAYMLEQSGKHFDPEVVGVFHTTVTTPEKNQYVS